MWLRLIEPFRVLIVRSGAGYPWILVNESSFIADMCATRRILSWLCQRRRRISRPLCPLVSQCSSRRPSRPSTRRFPSTSVRTRGGTCGTRGCRPRVRRFTLPRRQGECPKSFFSFHSWLRQFCRWMEPRKSTTEF